MSHNSWSFLKPRTIWGRMFRFIGKCQSCTIQEQYENYNVRVFDLRVKPNKNGGLDLCNRRFKYSATNLEKDLEFLNEKGDTFVQVRWEAGMYRYETDEARNWFIGFCEKIQNRYKNIKFFGGSTTHHCYPYYHFYTMPPKLVKKYTLLSWPWLIAKIRNGKIKESNVIVDYVQYLK